MFETNTPPLLRQEIGEVISAQPSREATRSFVARSCRLATALVRMRRRSRKWSYLDPLLSDEDIAMDALADALGQADDGSLKQVAAYFDQFEWQTLDEESLLTALRRFVFRKVEDGVHRMFQERDPGLARIIRALRNAANASEDLSLVRSGGVLWVCLSGVRPHANASTLPLELLERRLSVFDMDSAPAMIRCLTEVFRHQTLHRPAVPLTALALVVRAISVRAEAVESVQEDPSADIEWQTMVSQSTRKVCDRLWPSYEGRVTREVYEGYRRAAALVFENGYPQSVAVASCIDGADENYREQHRKVFEYMARRIRADLKSACVPDVSAIPAD